MTKHKVCDLHGALLDAAVAKAEGLLFAMFGERCAVYRTATRNPKFTETFWPSRSWEQGGPIIERERIAIWFLEQDSYNRPYPHPWHAGFYTGIDETNVCICADHEQTGPTLLIAAMRAYVASKFGEEVELP